MSDSDTHAVVRYLRECYRENGSRAGLWDFYGSSVRNRVFIEGEDDPILKNPIDVDSHFLRGAKAETAAKQTQLYEKERDLKYASIFVVGWAERFDGKPEAICAPLFLYPATLEQDGMANGAVLQIETSELQLNATVLEVIGGEDFFRKIEAETSSGPLSEGCVGTVRRCFAEAFPDAETAALLDYPMLTTGRKLKAEFDRIAEDPEAPFCLVPAAAIALINKSQQMRGVLNELEAMANPAAKISPPVRALLSGKDTAFEPSGKGMIPAHLSEAQQKVMDSSRRHPLTLAVGPPGTGKSFTIAALAIEAVSRGKSVIIASKMDHAVDVAGDKIESTIGLDGMVVRGGRKGYLTKLKKFVEELLAGIHTADRPTDQDIRHARKALNDRERRIEGLEEELGKRIRRELKWGALVSRHSAGWFTRWRQRWVAKKLESVPPLQDLAGELSREIALTLEERLGFLKLKRKEVLCDALDFSRASFQRYNRAIRSRTGTRQEEYFKDSNWNAILDALPVWLVNLSDVHKILPHTAGQFDLAIIDEASQCDIASALPILQRAERAVITGDPKQLRHLSFLPIDRQAELAAEYGLSEEQRTRFNFRDVSLLDLVSEQISDQDRIAFLNEHFRSRPEIIEFSNREFYAGQLRVMTGNHSSIHRDKNAETALKVTRVVDGSREANGTNENEATLILNQAVLLSQNHEKMHPSAPAVTIGILSPFRNQVDFLRKKLADLPGGSGLMNRNELLIGTAHTFQGEERDVMLISLVLDDESPSGSFRFLEKPDLFNVAITRARQQNHLFHSFSPGHVAGNSLPGRYLAFAREIESRGNLLNEDGDGVAISQQSHDQFAREVADFLGSIGGNVTTSYQLAGTTIDLMFSINGKSYGFDLVGYPGVFADSFPVERVLTFQRANLKIYPFAYSAWYFQRRASEDWIRSLVV